MNDPLAEQVIDHILRGEWDLMLDAGRAWNQAEKNGVIPQLIIITALLFKGNYREAYDHHEALFSKSEDVESQGDPRPRLKDFAETLVRNHDGNAGAHLFLVSLWPKSASSNRQSANLRKQFVSLPKTHTLITFKGRHMRPWIGLTWPFETIVMLFGLPLRM